MAGNSRRIEGAQPTVHPDLAVVVRRHLDSTWRQPLPQHTRHAFDDLLTTLDRRGLDPQGPLLLDSGCGTGASTAELARRHPQSLVLGIDQSAARLQRAPDLPDNALLVRAEAAAFWVLALAAGWQPQQHWLLYPNPWPKPGHLRRRWHGHPVWPTLLALGGSLVLRSNWQVYAQEFAAALRLSGRTADLEPCAGDGISPFERKYQTSGHSLWQVCSPA